VTTSASESSQSAPSPLTAGESPRVGMDAPSFRQSVLDHLHCTYARAPGQTGEQDIYRAIAHSVRDRLVHRWLETQQAYDTADAKHVYYLSSEFLTGRSLGLCLINLGIRDQAGQVAKEFGYDLHAILEAEGDPGLGNGGLGRLAACFMDSLATLDLPAIGYGIRYDFGIFEQRIESGWQVELHDNWLQDGNTWELPRHNDQQTVRFFGRTEMRQDPSGRLVHDWIDTKTVIGLPYDSFIIGHRTRNVNTLRLWAARAARDFDLHFFNDGDFRRAVEEKIDSENISKVLYPNDQTEEGKALRLKQQYFFVACSIADILKRYSAKHDSLDLFPSRAAIQLNDTHPSIAVAELMRVFVDERGLDWDQAWQLCEATIGYTNHTLLPEALEKWPLPLFGRLLPRHLQIIFEINQRFLRKVQTRWPAEPDRLARMSIIEEGHPKQVRMANLATVGAHSINGVARMHSELVKHELLSDFHDLNPEKFNNKTNGVTPRRWILHANPLLTNLISSRIGSQWIDSDLRELKELRAHSADETFLKEMAEVKRSNKRCLAKYVERTMGLEIADNAIFVMQVKRIHEYKRQLLACLQVIDLYLRLKENPQMDLVPRVYMFAGKAAAAYSMAKLHIKLLNDVSEVINSDPDMKGRLAMMFLPNYGVSLAESLIPAADVSLQISTAGMEASGTSNMKFALNGALTVGTLDGANVEIRESVGFDNFFLFGLRVDDVRAMKKRGYHPGRYIEGSPALARAIDAIESGFFSFGERDRFRAIVDTLRHEDRFLVCADFDDYVRAEERAAAAYKNESKWTAMALHNIAGASRFSSDATISQYAKDIWGVAPISVDSKH